MRRLLPLCLLLLPACRDFAVGPEAYEPLAEDEQTCAMADLGSGCSKLELDNGEFYSSNQHQSLLLRMGFESTARNLEFITLTYERPGQPVLELTCNFGIFRSLDSFTAEELRQIDSLYCEAVTLFGNGDEEIASVDDAARGVLDLRLKILAPVEGSHAINAWLTDANNFESPPVRWEFVVRDLPPPERETD